jgi:hypothetical protein
LVPETIIGVPRYDQAACIAYLIDKLQSNGFVVRYIHPNMLFISWIHFIPSYIRTEIKKKTGVAIDENGKKIEESPSENDNKLEITNPNELMLKQNTNNNQDNSKQKREYTPIKSYRPSGNLIYDDDVLDKISNKFL